MNPLMTQGRSNEEVHARYCAVRNVRIALLFVAFCTLQAFLWWRDLDKAFPQYGPYDLVWHVIAIAVIVKLFAAFACLRERFVLGLGIAVLVRGLVSGFKPSLIDPVAGMVRHAFLALWVVALLLSLSMLVSSPHRSKCGGWPVCTAGRREQAHGMVL